MTSVDIELALVGLAAMLEPATLLASVLALVIAERPLRTGWWFYVGGLGVTLVVGVLAAFVLGNAAASQTSTPKTWVSVLSTSPGRRCSSTSCCFCAAPPTPSRSSAPPSA